MVTKCRLARSSPDDRRNSIIAVAAQAALTIPREFCRTHALSFSWEAATRQFLSNLSPFDPNAAWSTPSTIIPLIAPPLFS